MLHLSPPVTLRGHPAARLLAQGLCWPISLLLFIFLDFFSSLSPSPIRSLIAQSDKLLELFAMCCDFLLSGFRAESTSAFTVPRGSYMELLKINQSHLTARGSALGCSAQGASRWPRILPARALILGKPGSKCTWVWGNDALCLSRAAVFSLSPVLCPSFRLCSVQALADSL